MADAPLSAGSLSQREALCALAARYDRVGWMMGTSGNLSAAVPGDDQSRRIVITASGHPKGRLGVEDFVELTLDGEVVGAGPGQRPSAEASIHLAIYRQRPDAGAALHVHTVASTVLLAPDGAPGILDCSGLEMVKGWGLWEKDAPAPLPVFGNHAEVPRIAREVEAWLKEAGSVPALVIRRHGLTAWGEDLAAADRHLEVAEFLCRVLSAADR